MTKDKDTSLISVLDSLDVKLDLNRVVDRIDEQLKKLDESTNAVVYNASDVEVRFDCYYGGDYRHWFLQRRAVCPPDGFALLNKVDWIAGPTIQPESVTSGAADAA